MPDQTPLVFLPNREFGYASIYLTDGPKPYRAQLPTKHFHEHELLAVAAGKDNPGNTQMIDTLTQKEAVQEALDFWYLRESKGQIIGKKRTA